ncbi:MAG: RnfABCDGE type electron transport complex subunit D [Bacillus subtilis]|nr:RnfABCDGE type electron transport complex subunit D [Bacillus subtilis]
MSQGYPIAQNRISTPKQIHIYTASLLVLVVIGAVFFGWYVLAITAVSVAASVAVEYLFGRAQKKKLDHTWMLSPLVFALIMPPSIPLWMVVVGSAFGTFFGKSIFGGYGKNVFNPALVGALFLTISFPLQMTGEWPMPFAVDTLAGATPLRVLHGTGAFNVAITDLLLGGTPGTIGEVFRLGILILGLALIVLKVIDWRIPAAFLGSVFVFNLLGQLFGLAKFVDPFYSLLVGGLLFGAFFVATDPVTAPTKPLARVLYGIGIGFFTVVIRNFAAFPEGITFAVILMNAIGAQFDSLVTKKQPATESEAKSA